MPAPKAVKGLIDDGANNGGTVYPGRFDHTYDASRHKVGRAVGVRSDRFLGRFLLAANRAILFYLVWDRIKQNFPDLFFSYVSLSLVFFRAYLVPAALPGRRAGFVEDRSLTVDGPVADPVDRIVYENFERVLVVGLVLGNGIPHAAFRFNRIFFTSLESEAGNGSRFFDGLQYRVEVFSDSFR